MTLLDRRRFLAISAACAAVPTGAVAETAKWSGRALGGSVSMQLVGLEQDRASGIFAQVEAEILRLEKIFSLFRPDSEISRLNRDGVLEAPSQGLLQVLSIAGAVHKASNGLFDPTVQPLWRALALGEDRDQALARVGWSRLRYDSRQVRLDGELTLNGIAQGAMTDRIAGLLRAQGLRDVLVDMGEIAARGRRADGEAWAVGVGHPGGDLVARLRLSDRALATSAPRATLVGGTEAHILNPNGESAPRELVSISASNAVMADALSTAACMMTYEEAEAMVARFLGARIEAFI